jgi:hypothetical protein
VFFFFFKQKTAYEICLGDWSSDVCSSDLPAADAGVEPEAPAPVACPCCGGRMILAEIFERGSSPRRPPPRPVFRIDSS